MRTLLRLLTNGTALGAHGSSSTQRRQRPCWTGCAATADVIPDLAIPVAQIDGNGYLELWHAWLGREVAGASGDAARADQVIYPIARTTRCGDIPVRMHCAFAG